MSKDLAVRETQELSRPAEPSIMELLSSLAQNPQVDVAKFQALVDLKERMERLDAEREFNRAFTRLKARLPKIGKDGKVRYKDSKGMDVSYDFPTLEAIQLCTDPILQEEGMSISYSSSLNEKGIAYHGKLTHVLGHSQTATIILPADQSGGKNGIQAIGSTVSYARRYLRNMLLDLVVAGEDIDARTVGFIGEHETNCILDMFQECQMDPKSQTKFLEVMGVKAIGDIKRADYEKAMAQLNAKLRKVRGQ